MKKQKYRQERRAGKEGAGIQVLRERSSGAVEGAMNRETGEKRKKSRDTGEERKGEKTNNTGEESKVRNMYT